jgi:UDP-N-acetylmuramate dehydrogenase
LLAEHTRFGLGGPASVFADAATEEGFLAAAAMIREARMPLMIIGGGTNLVVADEGYAGAVLRYRGADIRREGNCIHSGSGAILQRLVDFTIGEGLAGVGTMTGVPGWVGGAVYGNAGAYGNSIHSVIESVRFWDGAEVRSFTNAECRFGYRESLFKQHKEWVILAATFRLEPGDAAELRARAAEILAIRNEKYPPTMKCAGSIFKNLFLAALPEAAKREVAAKVVREGKVPSAWFLEQVGAKGLRNGGIEVAEYHANLIYNTGTGTARQVREVIDELKARVRARFVFELQEEVQYIGFQATA